MRKHWYDRFNRALDAAGLMGIIPEPEASWGRTIEENHRFGLGQPLYYKPEHRHDIRAYIATRFFHSVLREWCVEMVRENDITGQLYVELEDHMTDEPTSAKPVQINEVYLTRTGVALKLIRHPLA